MALSRTIIRRRVNRGLDLLLEKKPRKAKKRLKEAVASGTFDITSGCNCALGSVFDDYHQGLVDVGFAKDLDAAWGNVSTYRKARTHGFMWDENYPTVEEYIAERDALNEEWRAAVEAL